MAFNTALSGIRAAGADLDIIGNNVANAGTTGFKSSRGEFADVYAASTLGTSSLAIGSGVRMSDVAQQFTQGNVNFTDSPLDLAINGDGFFQLSDNGAYAYSRAGMFKLDNEGHIVNNEGLRLTGYLADDTGSITGQLGDLKLNTSNIDPSATDEINAMLNLDATSALPANAWAGGNPPATDTYNRATSLTTYDSIGNAHVLTMYFDKSAANTWDVHFQIDNTDIPTTATLNFQTDGTINPVGYVPTTINYLPSGADAMSIDISFVESTQYGSPFATNGLSQNGYATGRMTSLDIDATGTLYARYTNGQSKAMGQVVLANFTNPQGLQPLGDSTWGETSASGLPLRGTPGTGSLGVIQSGALEDSNVDLTQELVKMIVAQRNYQANAQTIRTEDAVTQTIINIR